MHAARVFFSYLDDGRCTNSNRGIRVPLLAAPHCLAAAGANSHGGLPPWSSIGRYGDVDWMLTTFFSMWRGSEHFECKILDLTASIRTSLIFWAYFDMSNLLCAGALQATFIALVTIYVDSPSLEAARSASGRLHCLSVLK